jgi:pimeloyl-ACP methyl ester carboxylesterase
MFYEYVKGNRQMNLQLNRQLEGLHDTPEVKADLAIAIPQLKDLESWYFIWNELGKKREVTRDYKLASAYFALAQFYLKADDPNKKTTVHKYIDNFYRNLSSVDYESFQVPYENSFLPAIRLNINPNARKTLLIINGFDSFMEEILSVSSLFKGTDYSVILFDGPGQGRALIDHDLKFTPYMEKPVGALFDYFQLDEVDALGISWGGYFVVRAAAFEKRIKRIACLDFFYDGLHAFTSGLPKKMAAKLAQLLKHGDKKVLNDYLSPMIKQNIDLQFVFNKGYENTGEDNPYDLLNNLSRHTVKGIGHLVTQDTLLLAGQEDQYVPIEDLPLEQAELSNAHTLKTKIFTKETGGEQHCQAGHYDLALNEIRLFLGQPALPQHETQS